MTLVLMLLAAGNGFTAGPATPQTQPLKPAAAGDSDSIPNLPEPLTGNPTFISSTPPVASQASPIGSAGSSATASGSSNPGSKARVAVATILPPGQPAGMSDVAQPAAPDQSASTTRLTDGQLLFNRTKDSSSTDPMSWVVRVYKSRHELLVYYKGRFFKKYRAVFGRSRWAGAKGWEGDLRTPEGNYFILDKHRSRRFVWFLTINYPNAIDLARFNELRDAREIPAAARAGGHVGIHGTDRPSLNLGEINWTTGCISVNNSDIFELAELLPIGTLVVINP